jgi:tetratricopeptide (TPR) repeat protein
MTMSRALSLSGILLVAGLAYWARPAPAAVRREPGLNVLLVTIDTLRADRLGSSGDALAQTPTLDRLAAAGVRFAQAHAHSVVTLPSHANLLSGLLPFQHGVRDNSGFRFPAGRETLASLLRKRGYRTGAFVSAFPLDARFGLARGFDVYDDRLGDPEAVATFRMAERPGPATVALAERFVASGTAPWFAWVHLYEPHAPYAPAEPFASRFPGDPYRGEVAAADAALRPLLEPLLEKGPQGRTLVVVTGDHGEGLGEHGERTHGLLAYEATLRVPLLVYAPRLLSPRVVSDPVRHVDVLPTILDALGAEAPPGLPGRSLLGLASGVPAAPTASYFEALTASFNRGAAPLHGLLAEGRKLVDSPEPELYDLRSDPGEGRNLVASDLAAVARLRSQLDRLRAQDSGGRPGAESAEARERLASLGYLAGGDAGPRRFGPEDDPKRLVALDAGLEQVLDRHEAGDLEGARAAARELSGRFPRSALVFTHVAQLEREAGELDAAVAALQRACGLSPRDPQPAALLGQFLSEVGRPAEAVAALSRFEGEDVDVLVALGAARAQAGDLTGALGSLDRASALAPDSALVLANVGTVHLLARDEQAARASFERALTLEPLCVRALNGLGVVEARAGHVEAALTHWRRVVALSPHDLDTLFNLGQLLLGQGRTAEARAALQRFAREAPPERYADDLRQVRLWLGS